MLKYDPPTYKVAPCRKNVAAVLPNRALGKQRMRGSVPRKSSRPSVQFRQSDRAVMFPSRPVDRLGIGDDFSMKNMLAAAFVASSAFVAAPANASTIDLATLVGSWDIQEQSAGVGDFFDNTYYASSAYKVKFTDLYVVGDEYLVFVSGFLIGAAKTPASSTGTFNSDPDSAYASGDFAHGLLSLSAGDTLSFQIIAIPAGYGDSTLAVTVASSSPEPASWAMMLGGFGLIGGAMRDRRKAAITFA